MTILSFDLEFRDRSVTVTMKLHTYEKHVAVNVIRSWMRTHGKELGVSMANVMDEWSSDGRAVLADDAFARNRLHFIRIVLDEDSWPFL